MFAVGPLLFLLAVAVVVWVLRSTDRGGPDGEQAEGALRRFLQYGFLLAAVFLAASGLAMLASAALPAGQLLARSPSDVALGLSLTLVGVPVWFALWRLLGRRLAGDPRERATFAWTLHLAAASTVALVVALVSIVGVGTWAVGAGEYDPGTAGIALVWSALWGWQASLWRRSDVSPTSPLSALVVLAGSAVGVVALMLGTAGVLFFGFEQVFRLVAGDALVDAATTESLRRNAVLVVVAAGIWWWHWLHEGVRAPRDRLWHAYVLLVPILVGTLTATVAAAVALHSLVRWGLGGAGLPPAAVHFDVLPGALAALAVGLWVWWYHRWVLGEGEVHRRSEADRTYGYLVAGVGLLAAAVGVTFALVGALEGVAPAPLARAGSAMRDTLAVATTLLAVGAPLWWVSWRPLQVRAHPAGEPPPAEQEVARAEVTSPSRRVYLSLLFGASALTAIISFAIVLFVFFRDLLEGQLDAGVLYDLRVALALLLTAGAVAGYHWVAYREDRATGPGERRPRTVLLVSSGGRPAALEVERRTGAKVRSLRRLDAVAPPLDPDTVVAVVSASVHERLLVVADADGVVRAIPYEVD